MTTRKSPTTHAAETAVGVIMKGNDKNYWIVLEKNKIKRWYPFRKSIDPKEKSYMVEFNGGNPFRVCVFKNMIIVYTYSNNYDYKKNPVHNKFVTNFTDYDEVFIGKDPKNKKYDGNTILIKLKKNTYVYIHDKIYQYTINDDITKFVSPMLDPLDGIAYPYGISDTTTYLFSANVMVPNNQVLTKDPYEQYYKAGMKGATQLKKKLIVDIN